MNVRLPAAVAACAALLASCSAPTPAPGPTPQSPGPGAMGPAQRPGQTMAAPSAPQLTLEGYKKEFAERVTRTSLTVFHDPLPKVLKSVVVLDVTIDRDGRVAGVKVQRSNGYKHLENVAMNSVRDAAPFASPARAIRRHDGSVNFLETFLFRDDGHFRVRTLVTEPQ